MVGGTRGQDTAGEAVQARGWCSDVRAFTRHVGGFLGPPLTPPAREQPRAVRPLWAEPSATCDRIPEATAPLTLSWGPAAVFEEKCQPFLLTSLHARQNF